MHTRDNVIQQFNLAAASIRFFNTKYPASYQAEIKRLEDFYKDHAKLPDKTDKTDEENAKFDLHRLIFIRESLEFLMKFHATGKTPITATLDVDEKEVWAGVSIMNCRYLIEHIAFTIYHLSGEIRGKYKHLLLPKPFTWETFEQLGGLMKVAPASFIAHTVRSTNRLAMKHFMDEHRNIELIVEEAIQAIIDNDAPQLYQLFSYIITVEKSSNFIPPEIKPLSLTAIKALTRRACDTESLDILLKCSDNHCHELPHDEIFKRIKTNGDPENLYMVQIKDDDKRFAREIDVSTQQGKHAALRRLERIGELIKGKNLSSFVKDLDPTIDWNAFIIIRDVIAHQDERDHKAKIEALLADEKRCKQILSIELQEFFYRLCKIIEIRDAQSPKYEDNTKKFWEAVFVYERQALAKINEALNPAQEKAYTQRAKHENIVIFLNALKQNNAAQAVQLRWLSILNGSGNLPNKREYGELLSHLPSRKINPELYKQCKAIADQALDESTTLADRARVREQQEQEAQKREQEREAKFQGLIELRRLAKELQKTPEPNYLLNPLKRIDAAIEALENIKSFLENDIFIQGNYNFPTLQAWEKTQTQENGLNFFARLLSCPELNDALEYNAAQLLQHLDSIKEYSEAKAHSYIYKIYPLLRNLRNWVEHGNDLLDKPNYDPAKEEGPLASLQKIVGPIMITLIIELLPRLNQIKLSVAQRQAAAMTSTQSTTTATQTATAPNATLFKSVNSLDLTPQHSKLQHKSDQSVTNALNKKSP